MGLTVFKTAGGLLGAILDGFDSHTPLPPLLAILCVCEVLTLGDGVIKVKSTNGDLHLGGDDFDQRIMNWLVDEFKKEQGIDLSQDRMARHRLKEASEKAKKELSSVMNTEIKLPFIAADANGPKHLNMLLTRSKLEQLVEDLVERSGSLIMKVLSDASIRPSDIDKVILVGNQARMPAIQSLIIRIFGREPNYCTNPDEAVAIGAAIQAGVLTGNVKDVLLLDVTPTSLSIETMDGVFARLIERNTIIPVQKSQIFSTNAGNQTSFVFNVLQGEYEFAKDNHLLDTFVLDSISSAPRGVSQIEVSLDLDANSIITVSACDKSTKRLQKMSIVVSSGLLRNQIDHIKRTAEIYKGNYNRYKLDVRERNRAGKITSVEEELIAELGNRLIILDPQKMLAPQTFSDEDIL